MIMRLAGRLGLAPLFAVLASLYTVTDIATKALADRLQKVRDARGFGLGWFDAYRVSGMPALAGGAGADTASYTNAMKTVYGPGLVELIPTMTPLYSKFEERPAKDWGGNELRTLVKVGRNQGVGAYGERAAIPRAGRQQYANAVIPMRYVSGRIDLSAQVMEHSQGNKNAFASAIEQEMRGLEKDLQAENGRMVWGDGRGVLALVNGTSTGTTVTVDSPGGIAGATNGSRFISPSTLVTFVTPGTGAIVASSDEDVITVPAAGTTFTTGTTTSGPVDNNYVVRANKAGLTDVSDTNYQKEPMGVLGMTDDGTYVPTFHGINRTTYPLWASSVISSVGPWSSDVVQRGIDMADQRGGGNIELLGMHQSVRRAYIAQMDEFRRYVGGDLSKPDAGTVAAKGKSLTFGGIELMVDKYAPYGTVFGWDTSSWVRYVAIKGEWADNDGSMWARVGVGTNAVDAFEAYFRIWHNFHDETPNKSFRLDGVTATVAVVHVD